MTPVDLKSEWDIILEKLGEEVVRIRLISPDYVKSDSGGTKCFFDGSGRKLMPVEHIECWLNAKMIGKEHRDDKRYNSTLMLTLIAAVAAVIAAIPVLKTLF